VNRSCGTVPTVTEEFQSSHIASCPLTYSSIHIYFSDIRTTIIESLKYAVSGAFPPGSSKGQAFVHDPKSIGLNSVKANVKLRFTSRSGQTMVAVRSMEVTQKKTTLQFKQLDGVLRMMDQETGQRVSLSHKCSELDKQLPGLLGVSKAVLEHVIFCHQEDASWPLMEGAVLKKRFDEIFDSTRYTKAIEVFRKTEKEMNAKVKDLKTELAGLASHKYAAQSYQKDLKEQNEQIELLDDEKKLTNETLAETEREMDEAGEIINQMLTIDEDIDRVKNELNRTSSVAEAQRKMLDQDLTETHTVQQLNDMLRDFDNKMASQVGKKDELETELKTIENKIEELRAKEKELNSSMGRYAAEKEAHEIRVKERYTTMENIAQKFNVDLRATATQDTYGASMTPRSQTQTVVGASQDDTMTIAPEDMQCFFQVLQKKEDGLKADLKSKRENLQSQEDELQAALTELGGKLKAVESGKSVYAIRSGRESHASSHLTCHIFIEPVQNAPNSPIKGPKHSARCRSCRRTTLVTLDFVKVM
jgi:DNA repair protein RAD50